MLLKMSESREIGEDQGLTECPAWNQQDAISLTPGDSR
jgi:hypothetical protein